MRYAMLLAFTILYCSPLAAQVTMTRREAGPRVELPPPWPRVAAAAIYDSAADRIVVYGGVVGGRADAGDARTWTWDGAQWQVLAESGPAPRDEIVFGAGSDGGWIVFGGVGNTIGTDSTGFPLRAVYQDTWRFAGDQWRLVDEAGPEHRRGAQGAFDARRQRFVVFGGRGSARDSLHTDTWEWDGQRWHRLVVPGPPGRTGHVLAYDHHAGVVILHGGVRSADRVALTDTWSWDGTRWRLRSMDGPRTIFGAAATAPDSGIVVFGGHMLNGETDTLWHWNGKAWSALASGGPPARTFNALVTDTRRKRIYIFGGSDRADLWYLAPDRSWTRVQ